MIDRDYCVMMARYNQWQNRNILSTLDGLSPEELKKERGAFFGSILGTLNHILWGDHMWMSRLEGTEAPKIDAKAGLEMTPTLAVWGAERFRMDGHILLWAEGLKTLDLTGDLTWYSGVFDRELTKSRALCIVHMFNHQTHHRGQVHAMMTQAGLKTAGTDLAFNPEED
ncbi:MAG: DinB family protein [Pseudomonadota bacterium]